MHLTRPIMSLIGLQNWLPAKLIVSFPNKVLVRPAAAAVTQIGTAAAKKSFKMNPCRSRACAEVLCMQRRLTRGLLNCQGLQRMQLCLRSSAKRCVHVEPFNFADFRLVDLISTFKFNWVNLWHYLLYNSLIGWLTAFLRVSWITNNMGGPSKVNVSFSSLTLIYLQTQILSLTGFLIQRN